VFLLSPRRAQEDRMAVRSPRIDLALTKSIRDSQFLTRDLGAVALARRYAALIEDAERIALELAAIRPEDEAQADQLARLTARVDAQVVAADLGPKLLAALAALGMTPAARASVTKGGTPGVGTPSGDALARLRAERNRATSR
jgi:hypothetical protein